MKENLHYSDKGGHFSRSQANKDLVKIQKIEGKPIPKGAVEWSQRRQMRRTPNSGR